MTLGRRRRFGKQRCCVTAGILCGVLLLMAACIPDVQAADGRAPAPKQGATEEIRELESQMEALEKQLDAIYEMLDDYSIDSAPPEVLAERQRVENQLQDLHDRRTRALREQRKAAPSTRRSTASEPRPQSSLRRKSLSNSIVKIGNDLVVRADEIVNGDAIILGGNLRVEGEVLGDVVVIAGDLEIARGARIGGQPLVIGGYLDESGGSTVGREPLSLSFFPSRGGLRSGFSQSVTLMFDVLQLLLLLVLALLFLALYRRRFARAQENLLQAVMAMLLLVTFLGIPVALLLGLLSTLVLLASLFLGAMLFGRGVQSILRLPDVPRIILVLLGLLVVLIPEMLGDVLGGMNPWVDTSLDIVSAVLTLVTLSFGLGTLVLTRMGRAPAEKPTEDLGESPAVALAATG